MRASKPETAKQQSSKMSKRSYTVRALARVFVRAAEDGAFYDLGCLQELATHAMDVLSYATSRSPMASDEAALTEFIEELREYSSKVGGFKILPADEG